MKGEPPAGAPCAKSTIAVVYLYIISNKYIPSPVSRTRKLYETRNMQMSSTSLFPCIYGTEILHVLGFTSPLNPLPQSQILLNNELDLLVCKTTLIYRVSINYIHYCDRCLAYRETCILPVTIIVLIVFNDVTCITPPIK